MITLVQAYPQWKQRRFLPDDDRQLSVLHAYQAFLIDTPAGKLGKEIPEALTTLWEATFE